MLRLAHRILSFRGVSIHSALSPLEMEREERHARTLLEVIKKCPIVVADNVEEYCANIVRPDENGDLGMSFEDFPHCISPFPELFVEWNTRDDRGGVNQLGTWITTWDRRDSTDIESEKIPKDGRFISTVRCVFFNRSVASPVMMPQISIFAMHDSGKIVQNWVYERTGPFVGLPCVTAFMAISFMHCKNVIRRDATESEGPPDKWLRRQKHPKLRYHVLEIDPMKEVLRTEGGSENNGLKKALHICRGHFATYSPDHPLFGKFTGTFWKPAHVRGSSKEGIVVKDYSIGATE